MQRTTDISQTRRLAALVLDDDPAALRAMRRALAARRFRVSCATDGDAGLALLLDELLHLDVLVVASDLPRRDARALADLVRRAGGERELALVVVADEATAASRAELLALGVDAVVERSAGGAALAAAALAAVAARGGEAPGPADELSRPRARPRAADGWAPSFGALALVDA
jgi:DNA-binding response OmpR family regulator